jgi:hypothetical protein
MGGQKLSTIRDREIKRRVPSCRTAWLSDIALAPRRQRRAGLSCRHFDRGGQPRCERCVGDASLNAPIREGSDSGEWQNWLVDDVAGQEITLAASDELDDPRTKLYVTGRANKRGAARGPLSKIS